MAPATAGAVMSDLDQGLRQAASSRFLPTSADIARVYSARYDVSICSIVPLTRQGAKKASANIQHLIMTMI